MSGDPDGQPPAGPAEGAGTRLGDPIRPFLADLASVDADRLAIHLDEAVHWRVEGLPTLAGRAAVIRFWRRVSPRYRSIRVSVSRLVPDGDLWIAQQVHVLEQDKHQHILIPNIAVYRVEKGRIIDWADYVDLGGVPEAELAVWRRMRRSP